MIFDFLFGSNIENISPQEVEKKTKDNGVQIIDVRYNNEYKQGHIPGAINIPYGELDNNLNKLDNDKEKIMVCTASVRSKKATKKLIKEGYENVKNMSGGMRKWSGKIDK